MSDPRIVKLSLSILESAIDKWNAGLSLGTEDHSEQKALLDLIHQTRSRIPELFESQDHQPNLQADGQQGLAAWLTWFSSRIEQTRLAEDCRSTLSSSTRRAISLLSTCESVHEAVESAARRQVYELAYGLTHEINNPLGNIVARAQQLLSKSHDPHDRKSLATVVDQAMRAHEMLAELMRAVQPRRVQLARVELVSLIREAFENAVPIAKEKNLECQLKLVSHEIWLNADRIGLMEALRLVSQNAIEACRQSDSIHWAVEEMGATVGISIEDTGPGLSPQAARRAFDLFYSGREAGRGLGVSLAVVRRYVAESQGRISLRSDRQLGCRVEMRFSKSDTQVQDNSLERKPRQWQL